MEVPSYLFLTRSNDGLRDHASSQVKEPLAWSRYSPGSKERMHFNTANRGSGRDDLAPICRKGQRGAGWMK